jgi:hypothetical protein
MPNVLDLLNTDHREVEQLFAQFESTQDFEIALQICQELTVHAAVEEEIVYPVLARIDRKVEQEAEEEHHEAKELIARIEGMSADDPDLVPTVMKLKGAIEHHVQEEEDEAWSKMRSATSADRLERLGEEVTARKQKLLGEVGELGEPATSTVAMETPATEVRGQATTATTDLDSMTRDELYELAKEAGIEGRSSMKKAELKRALSRR